MTRSPARIALAFLALAPASIAAGQDWQRKVHPVVLERAAEGPVDFLVLLEEQADLSEAAALETKEARGSRVYELLRGVAEETQGPLLELLRERGVAHRSFWIANLLLVHGDLEDVAAVAERGEVLRIGANPRVPMQEPLAAAAEEGAASPTAVEWNILKVLADQVWALGYDGSGIVIGGQDTGYEWSHAALIGKYRGWDGTTADHDYNWHDSIHGGGGICGANSLVPCDDHSHGTHTMGTMVGDDGGSNRIGMAPGAKWIGCRNMDQGVGTPATYTECFQWFVAPTDVSGADPDPARAPHVINNSWACPPSEGCDPNTLLLVVENTRAAGIVVVVSAGNDGSACETVSAPPAIYDAAFSVGATSSSDAIASFSSRGPVTVDGSNRLKPDVSAPGVNVRSSVPGGGYSFFSGTSMAGPHVAGQVALFLDARPDLIGRVDEIEAVIALSAVPKTSSQDCGDYPGSEVPNAVFGHGRIDALQALVGDGDGDGADNLSDCAPANGGLWSPPGPAGGLELTRNSLTTVLSWDAPASAGGNTVRYDVLRSIVSSDFSTASCLASGTLSKIFFDSVKPASVFYYLIRSTNACGSNLGSGSDGNPRSGPDCP
jgi:subtilisin family serine protease